MKIFTGNNPNVWKYVFDFNGAPVEAVLYRYPTFQKRTVLCISVQSGCSAVRVQMQRTKT